MVGVTKPRQRAGTPKQKALSSAQREPLLGEGAVLTEARAPDRGKRPWLLFYDEIPEWLQDNEYLLTGYRPQSDSYLISLKSLFAIHNETINIHSHLLGAALFATLPAYVYSTLLPRYHNAETGDKIVFFTFFFGVSLCFLLSACFHIYANHSPPVRYHGNQLDYLGIILLMWGSTIPTVYYGFYCTPHLQQIYWTVVSILACFCIYATFHPLFRHPSWRPYRAAMYASLGLSSLVFVGHGLLLYGWEIQEKRMQVGWMGVMGISNLVGAGMYAARIPERYYPETFDIVGSSHQILHVSVILAGIAHHIGLCRAFDYIHSGEVGCTFR